MAVKEAAQDVVSSIVLVDDNHLSLPVDMDHRYSFEGHIPFELLGILSGFSFALSAPGDGQGTVIAMTAEVLNAQADSLSKVKVDFTSPMTVKGGLAAIGKHVLKLKGILFVATGFTGNFKFQFAQNVADVGAIRVREDATLELEDYA